MLAGSCVPTWYRRDPLGRHVGVVKIDAVRLAGALALSIGV